MPLQPRPGPSQRSACTSSGYCGLPSRYQHETFAGKKNTQRKEENTKELIWICQRLFRNLLLFTSVMVMDLCLLQVCVYQVCESKSQIQTTCPQTAVHHSPGGNDAITGLIDCGLVFY